MSEDQGQPFVLPRVMSALIRIGLADLKKVEQDPRYRVLMRTWHSPQPDSICAVCLAGAVMACSLGGRPWMRLHPLDVWPDNHDQILALDYLRKGCVMAAAERLGIHRTDRMLGIEMAHDIPAYEYGAARFHAAMESLAADLEARGL